MNAFEAIDNYCERLDVGLLAEPLNAFSNFAFFIAAWLLYRMYTSQRCKDRQVAALIALVGLVGVGSTLFHTFANRMTMIGDVLFIVGFVFLYLWLCLRRFMGWQALRSAMMLALFLLLSAKTTQIPADLSFNGSVTYFPCLAILWIMAAALRHDRPSIARPLAIAGAWFALSLTFRSLDMRLCDTLLLGTHFLWHTLNGLVLYMLSKTMIDHTARKQPVS